MPKKLLYDIEQLITSQGKETGICRVSLELLRAISKEKAYEVYPLVTTAKGMDAEAYLKNKGLKTLADHIVKMPYLKKTTQNYNWYKKLCSWRYIVKNRKAYLNELKKYDEYISIFSPISPIVYKSGIKTKLIVHDLIPVKFPEFAIHNFAKKYRHWIKSIKADEVFCDSNSTMKDLLESRPDYKYKKVRVAHLAVDGKFRPIHNTEIKEKYGIKTDKYILSVSDQNPRKNFCHLINSFEEFIKQSTDKDISLVIVGPKARDSQNIKECVETKGSLQDKIILTGFMPDDDMIALYSNAEMFIYPSLYEGFGLPPLEAMSCGCPVISADNSSLPEVCGNAALYISGIDEKETATKIFELHNNSTLRKQLSDAGLTWSRQFSWQKTAQTIFNLNQGV